MSVRLDWRGGNVRRRVEEAVRKGIDATTAAAVAPAMERVPVRTGILRSGIGFRPAARRNGRWVGRVGVFDVAYALWVEIGTARMRARPFLRPAADAVFPSLARRIKGYL